ncbi:MAG TPA: NADPH-dependent FMN reductase [Gemmatimonadales bacterium]|nr:NADPH-dependent FMN reductase [Gemmatimonadales bacterium]
MRSQPTPRTGPFTVITLSGSLRASSSNTAVLSALAALAGPPLEVSAYLGLGELPHFNPDLDTDEARPAAVRAWRAAIAATDALVLCSPEYAHGVPGSLKNALDWLVSGPEFPALIVALINTSPRSTHAQAALAETIRTMSADLLSPSIWTVPLAGRRPTVPDILQDQSLAGPLRELLAALEGAIRNARAADRRLIGARTSP